MLCWGIVVFLFEMGEGAVESSSGMLFYKVICSDLIPEKRIFMTDIQAMVTQNSSQLPQCFL